MVCIIQTLLQNAQAWNQYFAEPKDKKKESNLLPAFAGTSMHQSFVSSFALL